MFWESLGEIIPLAFGIIVSPMPIVAVIALLLGSKGKINAVIFTAVFTATTLLLTLVFASGAKNTAPSGSLFATVLHIVLGLAFAGLFFFLAWKSWKGRPRNGQSAAEPKWLAAIDSFGPGKAVGLALFMTVANLKNIPIMIAAGASIGTAQLTWPLVFVAALIFTLISCLGLIVPTVIGGSGSAQVKDFLTSAKATLTEHNAMIMTVLFFILGAMQLGKAIGSFS